MLNVIGFLSCRSLWPARILVGVVLAASGAAAYEFGYMGGGESPELPPRFQSIGGLRVLQSDLDMGEVWEAKAFVCRLPIENETAGSITVTGFATSCGCLEVEPQSLTLPPFQSASLQLKVDLTRRTHQELGFAERPLQVEVTPVLKTGWPRESAWKLLGVVKSRVTLDKLALHFGETVVQGENASLVTFVLRKSGSEPTRLTMKVSSRGETPRPPADSSKESKP